MAAGHVHQGARSSTGTSAAFAACSAREISNSPRMYASQRSRVVAALLVHRVRAPGAQGIRKQVEHLPVQVALVADEGRDRLGGVAHQQALAHLGVAEALALGLT